MKNEQDQINQELINAVKKNYEASQIVVISSNKSLRTNIKKILTDMGFNLASIGIFDDYQTGLKIIEEHTPAIVICSLQEDKIQFNRLLEMHKKLLPNRYKNLFFLMTERTEAYFKNYKYDFDFKDIYSGVQNYAALTNFFVENLKDALNFTKEKLLQAKIQELINNSEIDKVMSIVSTLDDKHINSNLRIDLLAKISALNNNNQDALRYFNESFAINDSSYITNINLIKIYFDMKEYDKAFSLIKHFTKNHECSPMHIPIFLKVFLFNKDYLNVIRFCSKYITDGTIDQTVKLNMAAALALSGKHLITEKPYLAKESLELALSISGGTSFNILSMIITSILDTTKDYAYAEQLLDQYKSNFSNHIQYPILCFEVAKSRLNPNETFIQTTQLLKEGFKSKSIYESLINASIIIGRKKELIEDIVYDACNTFPENCDFFKTLIANPSA